MCGYLTMSYEDSWCDVCGWDGALARGEPWEIDDANKQSLAEAQVAYLADPSAAHSRFSYSRPPRPHEARDPGWRPFADTPGLLRRSAEAHRVRDAEHEAEMAARDAEHEAEMAAFNAALARLREKAQELGYRETHSRLRQITRDHDMRFCARHVALMARGMVDRSWVRHRPWLAASWFMRHGRDARGWRGLRAMVRELRTGTFRTAG